MYKPLELHPLVYLDDLNLPFQLHQLIMFESYLLLVDLLFQTFTTTFHLYLYLSFYHNDISLIKQPLLRFVNEITKAGLPTLYFNY